MVGWGQSQIKDYLSSARAGFGLSLATIIAIAIILLQIVTVNRTISLKLRLAFKILMAYVDRKKSNNCS